MASKDNWEAFLDGHPIFSRSRPELEALNLSINSLRESRKCTTSPVRRRIWRLSQTAAHVHEDLDLILAVDSEVRMASLGNSKASEGSQKSYKVRLSLVYCAYLELTAQFLVLHAPCVDFDIHQIRLSPNKKLLAVAGAFKVAVIVLPGNGFSKLVTSRVDCK